jgi:hypothetical protein
MDKISFSRGASGVKIFVMGSDGGIVYEGEVSHKVFYELLTGMHNQDIETKSDNMQNKGSVNALNSIEKFFRTNKRISKRFARISDKLAEDQCCSLSSHIIATVESLLSEANGETTASKLLIRDVRNTLDKYEAEG